jgi:hypothetical protein
MVLNIVDETLQREKLSKSSVMSCYTRVFLMAGFKMHLVVHTGSPLVDRVHLQAPNLLSRNASLFFVNVKLN